MDIDSNITSGKNLSFWTQSVQLKSYSKVNHDIDTDVLIIGAGISGVSIAYNLSLKNIKSVLIDDGFIGSGETGRTTAHLVNALDDRYYNFEKLFGEDDTKLIAESHSEAINFIEKTVAKENIDCDFLRLNGYLFLHPSDDKDSLQKEYKACRRAGLDVELVNRIPGLIDHEQQAICFKQQAQFHPLKYINALCDAITRNGGKIFTETHAKEIDNTGAITREGFKISAKHIVVATNSPVNNRFIMHLKQYPYRTYAIGMLIKKDELPAALWWDTGDFDLNPDIPPYHYIRTQAHDDQNDLLICGGEDHSTGLANADALPEESRYAVLEDWCKNHFPSGEIIYKWSGQVLEPMDSLAYIGKNPLDKDNIYIATGDSGNGMTHGTIAGILISDLITGRENPWEKIFSPSRFKIFTAGNVFLREVVNGFLTYIKEKPQHADDVNLSRIKTGEGRIVEFDGKKYGAYAGEDNKLHLVSSECTHLKCIISWNNDEKTWDCPCHGSRFTHEGKVINGPANFDLAYYQEEEITEHVNKNIQA
jgi:glycine/D-amino acid oxidase-like deaminating enzyme/nitrite reductase/ring-hydroxylating ferredoxin subunit